MVILLVPEPTGMLLLGVGLVAVARLGRKLLKNQPSNPIVSDNENGSYS
jgi:hypothetical protein